MLWCSQQLLWAHLQSTAICHRAANAFPTPAFQEMRHKAIAQDLSWLKPALKWEAVLEGLLTGSSEARDRGAAVRTPVQTPENVARSEKTAALREEAKVSLGLVAMEGSSNK